MSQTYDPYERLAQMRSTFENAQSRVAQVQQEIAAISVEIEQEDPARYQKMQSKVQAATSDLVADFPAPEDPMDDDSSPL